MDDHDAIWHHWAVKIMHILFCYITLFLVGCIGLSQNEEGIKELNEILEIR